MELKISPVTLILFFSFLTALGISIYSITKGYLKGQKYFTWLMLCAALYAFFAMMEASVTDINQKILWSKIEYLFVPFTPILLWHFVLVLSNSSKRMLSIVRYVYIIPPIFSILAFTNDSHQLIWKGFEWSGAGSNDLIYVHGILWYLVFVYSLSLILAAIIKLMKMQKGASRIIRKQIRILAMGCTAPFILTILYVSDLNPYPGLDLSAISTSIVGVFFMIGIFKYGMFKAIPIMSSQITKTIRDGLLVMDESNQIIYFNPSAAKFLEIEDTGFTFQTVKEVNWLSEAIQNTKDNVTPEVKICDDPEKWIEISISQISDDFNKFSGLLVLMHDITKRKLLEGQSRSFLNELRISHDKMTEAMTQKDRIISIIAHDLRTSFHQILSISQIITEEYETFTEDSLKVFLSDLMKASRQGYDILEELLNWARSQKSDKSELQSFPIIKSVEKIADELSVSLKNKNLTLKIAGKTDLNAVVDQNVLSITLRNFIVNAIKFSNKNSEIIVNINESDDFLEIGVTDTGIGIPEADMSKLFNPRVKYTRTGTAGESGSGLGLLLCKEMVERSGGTITVSSQVGAGSTFTIKLKKQTKLEIA